MSHAADRLVDFAAELLAPGIRARLSGGTAA